jgi:hypothetical protein
MTRSRLTLLLFLASCGGPSSSSTPAPAPVRNDGDFAVEIDPPTLDVHRLETGSIRVSVSRRTGISGPVMLSFVTDAAGLETTPATISGDEGTLTFRVTESAALGLRFPVLEAKLGGSTHRETLTLHVGGIVGKAAAVTIRDVTGTQIRQGTGDVVLDVDGTNLDRVTAFDLGDLTTVELPGRTATRLSLTASVPHGAPPGPKDLVLTGPGGDTVTYAALVVTAVTAGPGGKDDEGRGTTDAPVRTLTKALTLAQTGDTVRLLDGTYDAAHGEQWPLVESDAPSPIPAGVRIEGQSRAGAVLQGSGPLASAMGLYFAGDGSVAQLTIRDFGYGVLVTAGSVALRSVTVISTAAGLLVGGGALSATDCDVSGTSLAVIAVSSTSVSLSGGIVHDNAAGIQVGDGSPELTVTRTEITANDTGVFCGGSAAAVLDGAKIHGNRSNGVQCVNDSQLTVTSSELAENAEAGIWFEGRSLVIRGTRVRDNLQFGLYVAGAPTKVDLGNFLDPGNDDFHGNGPNGTSDQLLDVRTPRATLGDPNAFTLKGTQLNGVVPAPDVYPGDGTWPYLNSPYFSVLGTNNVIRVY